MFYVGQKVVCVKQGEWFGGYGDETSPIDRGIYTIRAVLYDSRYPDLGLLLEEIVNALREYATEHGVQKVETTFGAENFRPLLTTDISVFTAMLAPSPRKKVEV